MSFTEKSAEWLQGHPLHSPMFVDSAKPAPEPSRVPIESQASVGQLLREVVEELKAQNDLLRQLNSTPREGSAVSSIQIEDHPTKDRAVRITTKHYAGSDLDVMHALDLHGLAHLEAERRAMAGWIETIEALKA